MTPSPTHRAIEAVWRIESARLIGGLARIVRDIGLAEDLAQDALVDALNRWPQTGVPDNPGAWLTAAARYRAIDLLRRNRRLVDKQEELARDLAVQFAMAGSDFDAVIEDRLDDDVLGLIFACCQPQLPSEAQIALTLRLVGGLSTAEIANAFLVSETTLAQRLVRAKRALARSGTRFEQPRRDELEPQLSAALHVIYLIFNAGYSASVGEDLIRPTLCDEALRLARILVTLTPTHAEVHGLLSLMELQASRTAARLDPAGEPVLLAEQERTRWDLAAITRGLAALERADQLSGRRGPYALQAAIAAEHARVHSAEQTDWQHIAALYGQLVALTPSPVVELNRAVAVAMAFGPSTGLAIVDRLRDEGALTAYHLLGSVRGTLLAQLGRLDEARSEFERAATLTRNARERALLERRAAQCARVSVPGVSGHEQHHRDERDRQQ